MMIMLTMMILLLMVMMTVTFFYLMNKARQSCYNAIVEPLSLSGLIQHIKNG